MNLDASLPQQPRTARSLASLTVNIDPDASPWTALTEFVEMPTASLSLENLKEACIYVDSLEDNTVRMMLDKCPNLTTLRIGRCVEDMAWTYAIEPDFFGLEEAPGANPPTTPLTKLRTLSFDLCKLPTRLDTFAARVDDCILH